MLAMNKTSNLLIYQIPLARIDRYLPINTSNNLPCTNAQAKFSAGLYFCSLILKKDFSIDVIKYTFNENGKPILESDECGFSISYTNFHVYVAVIRNNMIGLDAEQINNIDLNVSREFMSEGELVKLEGVTNKYEYFYKIWTLKESYIKLTGTKIDDSIVAIEFIEDKNNRLSLAKEVTQKIYFSNFTLKDATISVASFNLVNFKIIDFDNVKVFLKKYEH